MSYFKLGKCENYRSKKENYRSRCLYFLYIVILDGIYIYFKICHKESPIIAQKILENNIGKMYTVKSSIE